MFGYVFAKDTTLLYPREVPPDIMLHYNATIVYRFYLGYIEIKTVGLFDKSCRKWLFTYVESEKKPGIFEFKEVVIRAGQACHLV